MNQESRRRLLVFFVVAAACIGGAVGYALHSASRAKAAAEALPAVQTSRLEALPPPASAAAATEPASGGNTTHGEDVLPMSASAPSAAASSASGFTPTKALTAIRPGAGERPYVLFRSTALGDSYGRVSAAYLDALGGERLVSPLQCDRVHFAAGHGICLEAKRGAVTSYHAHLFDRSFRITQSFPLAGPPSRARMSPDGRLAAVTVFVNGHSYGGVDFTTRTSLIDAVDGTMLAEDLEKFDVLRDGEVIKANDFNFWGVTFARDGKRFYATLGTAGKTLLVEGDLAARRMRVMRDDVECPSLSPDNRKIAFKRRHAVAGDGRIAWGIHVLELASGKEVALSAETRNVDDQVEWLGNREVLYSLPEDTPGASAATNVWAIAADGSGAPRLFVPLAYSPAVVGRP